MRWQLSKMNAHLFRVIKKTGADVWDRPDPFLGKVIMKYEVDTVVLAVAVHGRWIKVQEGYGGFIDRWMLVEDADGRQAGGCDFVASKV